jgi:4-amino-4-deoxy-L-arabinose transferase-like glycosyltransferase
MILLARNRISTRGRIVLTAICFFVLPIILLYPFHSDLDIHHCIGVELFRGQYPPYRAGFVSNLPGIAIVHWAAILLFGNSVFGFRLFETFFQLATVVALYYVCRFWLSEVSALLSVLLYSLIYVNGPGQFVGQPDCFAILPIILGVAASIAGFRSNSDRRRQLLLVSAGMLFGVATCFRPTFGLLLLTVAILFGLQTRSAWKHFVLASLGFAFVIGVCLLTYAISVDGLHEMYLGIIRYNADVYSHFFSLDHASNRVFLALGMLLGWAGIVKYSRRRNIAFAEAPESRAEQRFLVAFFCALIVGIVSMKRFAGYHLVPLFGLFMPVVAAIVRDQALGRFRLAAKTLTAGLCIFLLYPNYQLRSMFRSMPIGSLFSPAWYSDLQTEAAVAYVQSHTARTDAVEVATFDPAVRWRIDRPSVTRFNIVQALTTARLDGSFTEYQQAWQKEYLQNIQTVLPKYYLLRDLMDENGRHSSAELILQIPGIRQLLESRYVLDTALSGYRFYRRLGS